MGLFSHVGDFLLLKHFCVFCLIFLLEDNSLSQNILLAINTKSDRTLKSVTQNNYFYETFNSNALQNWDDSLSLSHILQLWQCFFFSKSFQECQDLQFSAFKLRLDTLWKQIKILELVGFVKPFLQASSYKSCFLKNVSMRRLSSHPLLWLVR